jgi:peptide-methionine (S)-S-oxide reductase
LTDQRDNDPDRTEIDLSQENEVATLGGGCFWCMEAVFSEIEGVRRVEPGYSGGWVKNPSYERVCSGDTGHAEVIQITFDPMVISYREILEVFFAFHDPTTPNRQGSDVGTQYRSMILYHDMTQKTIAEQVIQELEQKGTYDAPIVTQVEHFEFFYPAEEYHKEYFKRNPQQGYCKIVIAPKIAKLRKHYLQRLRQ